jgi:adenylate cyclase
VVALPPVVGLLALPLAALGLLLARPGLDQSWEHQPAHFWLVLAAGVACAALAYALGSAAVRRWDARVFLLSLAYLAAAGFLGLHALATPGVLLGGSNAGFVVATPVGLVIAGALAACSALPLDGPRGERIMPRLRALRAGLVIVFAGWGILSLGKVAPLDDPTPPARASATLVVLGVTGLALFALAAGGYVALWSRRRSVLLLGIALSLVLLAEAMAAVAVGRNWHASWWEWHLLMLTAFALVAFCAHREWHEERFADLYVGGGAGAAREVSVLFADLQGFTAFAEGHEPGEVSMMLNTYFGATIPPIVRRYGGEVDRIMGDALMVTFNRRGDLPDHAERSARAGLALQEAAGRVARPGWPRFRVGVNTGPAIVVVLGVEGGRTYSVVGDTVNLASRLEGIAPAGGVALGPLTAERLSGATTQSLGRVTVKGRREPVDALLLVALADAAA